MVTCQFRGGMSRATNFHVEINGSRGDLLLTSPISYVGLGGFKLMGAKADESLQPISVPGDFGARENVLTGNVRKLYKLFASDMTFGTRQNPTFGDAVNLHRLINAIEQGGGVARNV